MKNVISIKNQIAYLPYYLAKLISNYPLPEARSGSYRK